MSKITPIFKGKVKNNKLILEDKESFYLWLGGLEDKIVDVIVRIFSDARTVKQNKYLWGVVYKVIADDTGFSDEEIHQIFKKKYLTYKKTYKGKDYLFTESTTKLDTAEMTGYIDAIKNFASMELGIFVPDAEKVDTK